MDIVAVLTKVVQDQQKIVQQQQRTIADLSDRVTELEMDLRLKGAKASAD